MKKKCVKVLAAIMLLLGVSSFICPSYAMGWLEGLEALSDFSTIAQNVKELVTGGGGGSAGIPCWSSANTSKDGEYVCCAGCVVRRGKHGGFFSRGNCIPG